MGLATALSRMFIYAMRHPMGRRDRLGTVRRIVDWQVRSRLSRGPHNRPWINGATLRLSSGQAGATGNLYFGLYEFADMAFFAHLLRPDELFADIGANVGTYTVLAARVAGARVHAFEPIERTARALEENCAVNGIAGRVVVHRLALADTKGTANFTCDCDAMNRFADSGDAETVEVAMDRADDILTGKGLVAVKIDVEGAEPRVLSGMTNLLAEPQLVAIEIETVSPQVRETIEGAGFVERWYDPFARRLELAPNRMEQHNHLFLRNEAFVTERLASAAPVRFGRQVI